MYMIALLQGKENQIETHLIKEDYFQSRPNLGSREKKFATGIVATIGTTRRSQFGKLTYQILTRLTGKSWTSWRSTC